MSNEARNRLLPGYTDAAEAAKANGEKLQMIYESLQRNAGFLSAVNKKTALQVKNDGIWREMWLEEKKRRHKERMIGRLKSVVVSVFGVILAYIEITKGAEHSVILSGLKYLKGFI